MAAIKPENTRLGRKTSLSSNDTLRPEKPWPDQANQAQSSDSSISELADLWIHDDSFSKEDVLVNTRSFTHISISPGDLVQIVALKVPSDVQDFAAQPATQGTANDDPNESGTSFHPAVEASRAPLGPTRDRHRSFDVQSHVRYLFIAAEVPEEILAKHPDFHVSLHSTVAITFGFRSRTQVVTSRVRRKDCTASHVELIFRDAYLARSDMWRLVNSELACKSVYKAQKINFLGTIKATVTNVWVRGQKVPTAYFSESTVPVFRSESARYVLFIQMSREMWDFDSEGTGEILFNRVVTGFLPDLFKRWAELEVKHLVSIVMFGRMEYGHYQSNPAVGLQEGLQLTARTPPVDHSTTKDFYRVVVTDMASGQWTAILDELKKQFRIFLRDISLRQLELTSLLEDANANVNDATRTKISGRTSTALRGNILEAINIASTQFANDYIDRDLVRTGISIVVITPGPGVFEVDRDMLKMTSANLTNNGIGIDLVCLAKMPLHSVPLFKYRKTPEEPSEDPAVLADGVPLVRSLAGSWASRRNGLLSSKSTSFGSLPASLSRYSTLNYPSNLEDFYYGIPQWIDLSYWPSEQYTNNAFVVTRQRDTNEKLVSGQAKAFVPRLRMYELQMMGIMELGLANISVPYISDTMRSFPETFGVAGQSLSSRATSAPRKGSTGKTRRRRKPIPLDLSQPSLLSRQKQQQGDFFDRMEDYDDSVFGVRPRVKQRFESGLTKTEHVKKDVLAEKSNWAIDMAPLRKDVDQTETQSPPATRPSVQSPLSALSVKAPSVISKAGPAASTSRLPRAISFGLRGLSLTPRATASTGVDLQNAPADTPSKSNTTSRTSEDDTGSLKSPSILEPQLKGYMTSESGSSGPSERAKENSPAKPIKIESPAQIREPTSMKTGRISTNAITADTSSRAPAISYNRLEAPAGDLEDSDGTSEDEASQSTTPSSATEDFEPWLKNVNPSNPAKSHVKAAAWVGKWQHLYPQTPKTSGMKWKSLCTPAAVPLTTEDFPSRTDLEDHYDKDSYVVAHDASKELSEVPKSRESLVYEMLGLRLAHGYQFVVGANLEKTFGAKAASHATFFQLAKLVEDDLSIFMYMGNTIQELSFTSQTEVRVTKYVRKRTQEEAKALQSVFYQPSIRTILSPQYTARPLKLTGFTMGYPWQDADNHLAGRIEDANRAVQRLRFWRARFVLIPVEPPSSARRPVQTMSEENEEEIHLHGIRTLTQMWQRYRYIAPEDRKFKPMTARRKDTNPLDINFQTLNPSEVVATELDKLTAAEGVETQTTRLLPDSELLERETCTVSKLAQIMQSDKGVDIITRRWHLRLHFHCFKGDDFTTWLSANFKDIDSREEAVEFGNELMQHSLFQHVDKRHNFKDGHFFYQIDAEYRAPRPEAKGSWFTGSRRSDKSVPPASGTESGLRESPSGSRSRSGSAPISDGDEASATTPAKPSIEKKRMSISLSKMLRLDVDTRKKSNRPEIINLHYDRLHNPENCYHLEISWMNVTSKLVEDAIVTWATQGERYGLKLVEVPIAEASSISEREPFRAPSRIKLCVQPPKAPIGAANGNSYFTSTSFTPQAPPKQDPLLYHKELLKRFNFVLDLEAASDFPPDVEVEYSWGKLEYHYTQFVHRSGIILAQITDEGEILLLANRLYNTRSASTKDTAGKFDSKKDKGSTAPPTQASGIAGLNVTNPSPQPSPMIRASAGASTTPMVRATADVFGNKAALKAGGMAAYITPEQIKWDLEDFCSDKSALEQFFRDVAAQPPVPQRKASSTSSSILRPVRGGELDNSIPELVLPASLAESGSVGSLTAAMKAGTKTSPGTGSPKGKPTE